MATEMNPIDSNKSRCDMCGRKDQHKKLSLIQCIVCKMTVHKECYGVPNIPKTCDFTCFACDAVGRTFQAVETHLSNKFYSIKQETRATRCQLCSISDGIHAMHPLYDYHGNSGRQICRRVGKSNNNVNSNTQKNMTLAWAHSLCSFYLSSLGFLYACDKSGKYVGIEDDETDDNVGLRPPNPELVVTDEFTQKYGPESLTHFRYYLRDPAVKNNRDLDEYTKAVVSRKKELKCTICGLDDSDDYVMRIPMQCVANDPDEPKLSRVRHKDLSPGTPCFVALHVGCAMWNHSDNRHGVKRVYYYPGYSDTELGHVFETSQCLYCTKHAEDVDEKFQKKLAAEAKEKAGEKLRPTNNQTSSSAVVEQNRLAYTAKPRGIAGRKGSIVTNTATSNTDSGILRKGTSTFADSGSSSRSVTKQKQSAHSVGMASILISTKPSILKTKNVKNTPVTATGLEGHTTTLLTRRSWFGKRKVPDRHAELDSSQAYAVNAGEQPTLAKKRRELANQKSSVTEADIDRVFEDLLQHQREDTRTVLSQRRNFWKRQLSVLSSSDFESVWKEARNKFLEYCSKGRNNRPGDGPQKSPDDTLVTNAKPISLNEKGTLSAEHDDVDDHGDNPFFDISDEKSPNLSLGGETTVGSDEPQEMAMDNSESHDHGMECDNGADGDVPEEEDAVAQHSKSNENQETPKQIDQDLIESGERPPDRWSSLFLGPTFKIGNDFTLDDFEEYIPLI